MAEQSDTVTEVIDGRRDVYGDPAEEFKKHALMWSAIFGVDVRPDQVALALIAYKLVRANRTPNYSDNSDDVEGYLDIFRKVVGPDMIHARSVSDYLAEVERRQRVATAQAAARDLGLDSEKLVDQPLPGLEYDVRGNGWGGAGE